MSTIADLLIKVRADTGGAEKDISSFGSKVAGGFHKALLPATAALGVMGVVGKAAFDNLQDGANNAKQTEAVLKSTGDASKVTAQHVDDLAMSLRRQAGVDDDVVHAGENMLLTFTNIRNEAGKGNDIFDQATKTMLDMSHALGQDTKSSAIQLGKALNDPIKGVTALQRVGVSFTDAQKKQIKAMVDSGHTMQAQKLILHELNKEFGGSAEHIDPTTKSLANLKLDMVDLASNLLQSLLPALRVLTGILQSATNFMTQHSEATKIAVGVIAGLSVGVIAVNAAMKLYAAGAVLVRAATTAWTAAQWLLNAALSANPIGVVIIALAALGAAIAVAWTKSETFRNIVTGAWNAIRNTTLTVFNAIKSFFQSYWPILLAIVGGPVGAIAALVITKWDAIRSTTSAVWNGVKGVVLGVLNGIRGTMDTVFNAIVTTVQTIAKPLTKSVDNVVSIFNRIKGILDAIIGAAQDAWHWIQKIANAPGGVLGKIGGVLGHIPGFASGVTNFGGGLAVVGEQGPELVHLPAGSSVFSNAESRSMFGRGVNIEHMEVRSETDVRLVARELAVRLGA